MSENGQGNNRFIYIQPSSFHITSFFNVLRTALERWSTTGSLLLSKYHVWKNLDY